MVAVLRSGYFAFANTFPLGAHIKPDVTQRASSVVVSETVRMGASVHGYLTSS